MTTLENHADKNHQLEPVCHLSQAEIDQLHEEAIRRFGAKCIWNARPSKSVDGLQRIIIMLRDYGNLDAWHFAAQISRKIEDATR